MHDTVSTKQEPGSMEELVGNLSKPFEFHEHKPESEVPDNKIETPSESKEQKLEQQASKSVEKEAEEFNEISKTDLLKKISEFGGKDIGIKTKIGGEEKKEVPQQKQDSTPPVKKNPNARDYSGFTEQEAALLARMSNEAFDYAAPIIREHRDIKKKYDDDIKKYTDEVTQLKTGKVTIPDNYYENPDAVILTPEFSQAQNNYQAARDESQHWASQLAAIEKGDNWTDLTNDPKTGQRMYGKVYEPGPEARAHVLRNMSSSQNIEIRRQAELENLVQTFTQRHQEFKTKISEAEKTIMPYFEDKTSPYTKIYEQVTPEVEKFGISPKNPAFTMLAKSIALNFIFRDALMEANEKVGKTQMQKADEKKAGPTGAEINGAAGASPNTKVERKTMNFSDMDKLIKSAG